ncbi:MAG: alpha-2-macroglobulin family protein [Verrucomicrobiota bacterium]
MKTPSFRRWIPASWFCLSLTASIPFSAAQAAEKTPAKPLAVVSAGTEIIVPAGPLNRETSVEVRFPAPMVAPDLVGREAAAESVMEIKPALPGRFLWRSTRSGTFEPQGVPPLGVEFRIGLKAGLKDAQGRAVTAPAVTATAPAFVMRESTPRWFYPSSETTRQPEITLFFNDAVSPAAVAKAGVFTDKAGRRIPVSAITPRAGDLGRNPPAFGPWEQQQQGESAAAAKESPAVSVVRVKPASALPPGENWSFQLETPVSNLSGKARLAAMEPIRYGTVTVFELGRIAAEPVLDADSELQLSFNKKLPELKPAELAPWISVSPAPENLTWTISGQMLTAKGAFKHGADYTVSVKPGLPAADSTALSAGRQETLKFEAHAPQLSLPAFDHAQWIGGKGDFAFSTANLKKATLKIKKADAQNVIYLLNGYATYEYDSEHPDASGNTRLPWAVVPGKTVWEKEFPSKVELNRSERFGFTWDEAAGGKRQPGIYFVSLEGQPKKEVKGTQVLGAQAVVQLSDIGLAWKYAGKEALIYAFSHTTGQPLPGTVLRSFTAENELSETVTTGPDGMTKMVFGKTRWLIAQSGEDLRGVRFDGGATELDRWAFDVPVDDDDADASAPAREMMIFTERPVYQPGETVFFKAITRLHKAVTLTIPEEKKAKLFLFDPQNRAVLNRDIEFSDTGSFSDGLRLPAQGLGWFRLRVEFPPPVKPAAAARTDDGTETAETGGADEEDGEEGETESGEPEPQRFEQMVLVQEYQPNAFRIVFDDAAAKFAGETLSVPVRASYLMGKALDGSEMKWTSHLSQASFRPDGFEDYRFCHAKSYYVWDGERYQSMTEETALQPLMTGQGTVKLSPKGETLLEAKVPATFGVPGPKLIAVNTEITDLNQQTIAESWQHTEHTSDFYLGVRRPANAVNAGAEVPLSVVAVDAPGGRHKTAVPVKVLIEHLAWNAVRVQTAGGGTDVRNDLVFAKVGEEELTVSPEPGKEQAWTFKPQVAGTHNLTFTAKDESGREVRTVISIDVFAPASEPAWRQDGGVRIELVADKDKYAPGDTAKVVVKSPFSGLALVTVERERVLRSELKKVESGGAIELKIDDDWAPNVFVSVMQVRGGADDPREHREPDYRVGYCALNVESQRDILKVELRPSLPEVRPGAMVEVAVAVRDAAGKPVPDAELAVWAVDEGILSLMPWQVPDPAETFHYDSPLFVRTGISLQRLLSEDPEKREFTNKGFVIGGGGDTDGSGKAMRKDFKPTAYWHGMLRTGEDGVVRVSFPAPDNLTEFRLAAVATEGVSRFGKAESHFKVNQPLMLEPALPRFANVGDEITLKAVLHNTTEKAGGMTVELTGDDHIQILTPGTRQPVEGGNKATRTVHLAAQQSKAVPFAVKFIADGPLTLQWKASCATEPLLADAVESEFTVGFAEPLIREVRFPTLQEAGNGANLLAKVRPELLEGNGKVTVTLANSRLLEGAEAVEHLLHYPYGCAEQTMSSMLPWLTLRDLKQVLPDLIRPDAEIASVIQKCCDRLLSMQTAAGGLAYWPGGAEPSLWASAHGALGLTLASRSGAQVPADRLENLTKWLSQSLRDTSGDTDPWNLTERVYAAYALALAGKAEPGYHEVLFNQRQTLPPSALALLALAIVESEGPEEMAKSVLAVVRPANSEIWWGDQSTKAMRTMALLKLKDPAADEEMGRLMGSRSPRGDWSHSFANSWVLMALSKEARMAPLVKGGSSCVLTLDGKTQEITLPETPASKAVTLDFQAGQELPVLSATLPAGQRLFAKVEIAGRGKPGIQPARSAGFAIERSWQKVAPDGTLSEPGPLRTGDLVQVTLKLDIPASADYLAIDDPLPATFEAVNPHFTSMASPVSANGAPPSWFSDYTEMRRDRVLFFRDSFEGKGSFRVNYLARVVAEGTVTVPAAKIEMMYDPSRFGLSPSQKLTTEPAPDDSVAGR